MESDMGRFIKRGSIQRRSIKGESIQAFPDSDRGGRGG